MICTVCGLVIEDDEDVVVEGGSPMCGECARPRKFDELLWEVDAADGVLDGELE
jgi:hypothetical protein